MQIRSHEDLEVWQRGMELVKKKYILTDKFPPKEKFRLVDQMCRAAISIPSNIAEGSARKLTKEFMRYIAMALGSLAELKTQLSLALQLDYLDDAAGSEIFSDTATLGKKSNALYVVLERKT